MKTKLLSLLVLIPIFLFSTGALAQTTLAPGDIVVIQLQGDDPDSFAFVTFVDIDAGTGIFFTDCGVSSVTDQFRSPACTEGARKYTAPAGGLDAGDIIKYSGGGTDFTNYSDSRITGTNFLLSTGGDQIVVFQDTGNPVGGTNAASNPTFIYILSSASTLFTGDPTDSNETSLPSTLSSPVSALALGANTGVDNEFDNVIYNASYDFSGFTTEAEAINSAKASFQNPSNYLQVNTLDANHSNAVLAMPDQLNLMVLSTEEVLSNSFAVYPNPSDGNITIRNSGVALQNVTITDLNGRTMGSFEMNGITTNTDLSLNLNTGMYFMKLTTNDASTTKKLIIK
ncbi:T9SS type A sorting domain-containing protein [uncultured Kordia sp.]|uniref:T9SS type A sorting domain-containing protein n=1 Tax=uncultured Kordia sp. TaxID=507699 RepID=UPI002631C99B|nr:T9SS type A sorting domain-containing protein [uncultured Kordia sp.]